MTGAFPEPGEVPAPIVEKLERYASLTSASGVRGNLSEDAIRLARREAVWELRCKGWLQSQIADAMGINQSTVSRDLSWCFQQVRERLLDQVERVQVEQIGRLEYIISEALEAWRNSKKEAIEVRSRSIIQKRKGSAQGQVKGQKSGTGTGSGQGSRGIERTEQTTIVQEQTGDPRYLSEARRAMADIRKIVGADVVKLSLDPTGSSGGVVIVLPGRLPIEDVIDDTDDIIEVESEHKQE